MQRNAGPWVTQQQDHPQLRNVEYTSYRCKLKDDVEIRTFPDLVTIPVNLQEPHAHNGIIDKRLAIIIFVFQVHPEIGYRGVRPPTTSGVEHDFRNQKCKSFWPSN